MKFAPPHALGTTAPPLRRMSALLLLLCVACVLVWNAPNFQPLRTAQVMPLWVHTVVEFMAVAIAFLLFGIVWNAYSRERSGSIVILGCAATAIGMLDLGHALSYRGMPDFVTPAGTAKGINFWLAARLLFALVMLAVAIRPSGPLRDGRTRYLLLGGSLGIAALVYWLALFHPDWWPDTFVDGVGLTDAKIAAEWIIIAILGASAVLQYRRAREEGTYDAASFFGVAVISILSELCFTAYISVNDIFNLFGHLLKIVAYLFLYRAAFVASVREPFRQLRVEVGVRQRAEEALRQLNLSLEQRVVHRTRELQQANRELEAFSYSVSHDLRAPLRAIEGFSRILQKNYEPQLDEKGKDYLGRVRRASERMGELIDDMLDLSRLSRQEVMRSVVDVSHIAQRIADDLRQRDPARSVEITIAPGMRLEADAKLLRIVLENLIGNAWKFSARTAAPRIDIGMQFENGVPVVFVRDNGAGFSMEYAHKLFSPFQRLHSGAEFEGSGIGLATVQRIVQRHGGRAWAEGAEGRGATFYFSCEPQPGEQTHA